MSGIIRVDTAAAPPPPPPPPPPPAAVDTVIISMQDNVFVAPDTTVAPGTLILWRNDGARPHTATSDTGIFSSGNMDAGQSWSYVVPASTPIGTTLPYFCDYHGAAGGIGMSGIIRVDTAAAPPPPPPPPPGSVIVTTEGLEFNPDRVEIPVGGSVTWVISGTTHNITFRDTPPAGGNIPDSPPGSAITRVFVAAGDYDYECTLHKGQEGRVRVR